MVELFTCKVKHFCKGAFTHIYDHRRE